MEACKKALVNRIIPCSLIDGPGSRTVIFFQGCNMQCQYCHNPETQRYCNNCGKCVNVCKSTALGMVSGKVVYNRDHCIGCDRCIRACENFSSPKCIEIDMQTLIDTILENEVFLDGITLSGGECTLRHDFIYELFKWIKENTGLTTFIDTNGYMTASELDKLSIVTDGFMFDLKCLDNEKHIALTGLNNEVILRNMRLTSDRGLLYEVRTVILDGFTGDSDEITNIARHIKHLNDYTKLKLIPFRPMGVKGRLADCGTFDENRFKQLFQIAHGILGDRAVRTI